MVTTLLLGVVVFNTPESIVSVFIFQIQYITKLVSVRYKRNGVEVYIWAYEVATFIGYFFGMVITDPEH